VSEILKISWILENTFLMFENEEQKRRKLKSCTETKKLKMNTQEKVEKGGNGV
jgi:hypothetical protein